MADVFKFHIEYVLRHLPTDVLSKLNDIEFRFLAPDPIFLGLVTQLHRRKDLERRGKVRRRTLETVVYLSPKLIGKGDDEIRGVIAHELAHLFLGHKDDPSINAAQEAEDGEREANELARKWGFENLLNLPKN